ncbi:MAG: YetF domain-containing protein [Alteraurantiacibacter sp.]
MIDDLAQPDRLWSVAISAVFFYFFIVILVRVVGKRTTSQLNNFDWIINITVGSLAASGILLRDVGLLDAGLAIAVLATLQMLTTWSVLRSKLVSKIVKAQPVLLTHKGEFLRDAMRNERISEEEICSALRAHGMYDVADANWIILETNGELVVIPRDDIRLRDVGSMGGVSYPDTLADT